MWQEDLEGFGEKRLGSKHNTAEGVQRMLEPEDGEESYKLCPLCDMVLAH